MGKDLTKRFAEMFTKYSAATGERTPRMAVGSDNRLIFDNIPYAPPNSNVSLPVATTSHLVVPGGQADPSAKLQSFVDYSLYPELGAIEDKKRKEEARQQELTKLKSLGQAEISFLRRLEHQPFLIEVEKVKKFAAETGETLGTERLEQLKLVRREREEAELLFSITDRGRQVLNAYRTEGQDQDD